jgi:hypothetical protein
MNTSTNNPQTQTTNATARTAAIRCLRRAMAGAMLAAAITTALIGLAATSQADTGTAGATSAAASAPPARIAPSFPRIDGFGNGTPWYHPTPHHCHGHCH